MTPTARRTEAKDEPRARNVGLFRTILAGSGHSLADAFAIALERSGRAVVRVKAVQE